MVATGSNGDVDFISLQALVSECPLALNFIYWLC